MSKLLRAFALTALVAGCSSDTGYHPTSADLAGKGSVHDLRAVVEDMGEPDDSGMMMCIPMCNTHQACQDSCPSMPDSIACCDTDSHMCFLSPTMTCPAKLTDLGGGDGPYRDRD